MQRNVRGRLLDIRDAAAYIVEDTAGATYDTYQRDRRMRQLVEHNFVIIGEAMHRLRRHSPTVAAQISAHEKIIGLGNVLVHGYAIVQPETIWETVRTSLPVLRTEVAMLLDEAERKDPPQP